MKISKELASFLEYETGANDEELAKRGGYRPDKIKKEIEQGALFQWGEEEDRRRNYANFLKEASEYTGERSERNPDAKSTLLIRYFSRFTNDGIQPLYTKEGQRRYNRWETGKIFEELVKQARKEVGKK